MSKWNRQFAYELVALPRLTRRDCQESSTQLANHLTRGRELGLSIGNNLRRNDHDRMLVIIPPDAWLDPEVDGATLPLS